MKKIKNLPCTKRLISIVVLFMLVFPALSMIFSAFSMTGFVDSAKADFFIPEPVECFIAGTKILMADDSTKNIEDVCVGDIVKTVDLNTMKIENKPVLKIQSNFHTGEGWDITIRIKFSDGTENQNTNTHPYFVKDKGYASYAPDITEQLYGLDVKLLEKDDIVYKNVNGELREVIITDIIEIYEPVQTYNLMNVKDNHNFFANGILVHNKGDGPTVSNIPDQPILKGESYARINLDNYVSDPDNSYSEISWSVSGDSDLTVNIDGNRRATVTYPSGWSGSERITFRATDPDGHTDTDSATFTVNGYSPVAEGIPDKTAVNHNGYASFSSINLDAFVSDLDNIDSDMSWTASNSVLTVDINNRVASVYYQYTPPDPKDGGEIPVEGGGGLVGCQGFIGSVTITFTATDPDGNSDSDSATFTVNPPPQPPVVSDDIPKYYFINGAPYININLNNYVSDYDNSDSEISWSYNCGRSGHLSGTTFDNGWAIISGYHWSSETITFTATDPNGQSDSSNAVTITWEDEDYQKIGDTTYAATDVGDDCATLHGRGSCPCAGNYGGSTFLDWMGFQYDTELADEDGYGGLSQSDFAHTINTDNNMDMFLYASNPGTWGAEVTGLEPNRIYFYRTISKNTHTVHDGVKDCRSYNYGAIKWFITGDTNNDPNAVIDSITPNPADEGESIAFEGTGSDSDGSIVAYEWSSSINGAFSSEEDPSYSGLSVGTHTISFKVQDDDGEWSSADTETLTIIVGNIPPTATIDSITPNPADEGESIAFEGTGSDSDGTVVAYEWSSNIDGKFSTEEDPMFSGLSVETHTISFKVQDDDGEWSDSDSATFTVNPVTEEPGKPSIVGDIKSCYTVIGYTFESEINSAGINAKYYFYWDDGTDIPDDPSEDSGNWKDVPPTLTLQSDEYSWSNSGVYDVKVGIYDPDSSNPETVWSPPFPVQVLHKSENPEDG